MTTKKTSPEVVQNLHAIVIELNLAQRRRLRAKIEALQKFVGDTTDIDAFTNTTVSTNLSDGRGSHWAERRLLQKFHLVDESGAEKELNWDDLVALTKRTQKQLQVAFYKGNGQIQVTIKNPKSYGTLSATVTKL